MKYIKFLFTFFIFALAGCSNDDEAIEWPDVGEGIDLRVLVTVIVQDSDGNHLYSDEYHGILDTETLAETVSCTYQGETKALAQIIRPAFTDDSEDPVARRSNTAENPTLFEYATHKWNHMVLAFGAFYPWENNKETFTVNWPDGTHSKVDFESVKLEYPYTDRPNGWIKVRLEGGEWVEADYVTVVK